MDIVIDITGGVVGTTLALVIYQMYQKYQADKRNDSEHERVLSMIKEEQEARQKADQMLADSVNELKANLAEKLDDIHSQLAAINNNIEWLKMREVDKRGDKK
jgi:uncharacterized protein YlxW (UPF0749 family)